MGNYFARILPLFGFDTDALIVPARGANFIYHYLGDASVSSSNAGIEATDVTDIFRTGKYSSAILQSPHNSLFTDQNDMVSFFQAAAHGLTADPAHRIVSVKAMLAGSAILTFKSKISDAKLAVQAVDEKPVNLSLRYIKYTGDWAALTANPSDARNYSRGTTRNVSDSDVLIQNLNRFFKHNANITVAKKSASDQPFTTPVAKAIGKRFFNEELVKLRDQDAMFTLFIAEYIQEALGIENIESKATIVAENPEVALSGDQQRDTFLGTADDKFLMVCAHEMAHALGAGHIKDAGQLMSDFDLKQSFFIGPESLQKILATT